MPYIIKYTPPAGKSHHHGYYETKPEAEREMVRLKRRYPAWKLELKRVFSSQGVVRQDFFAGPSKYVAIVMIFLVLLVMLIEFLIPAFSLADTTVSNSLFGWNTILKSDTPSNPVAMTIPEQRLVGRVMGGLIAPLTQAEAELLLTAGSPRWQQKTMPIQVLRIQAHGVPTRVTRGIFQGFSMPIWNGGGNVNEELYSCQCVPGDWYEASDLLLYIGGWISQAENDRNFQLQASWEHWTAGDVVPITTIDVPVETNTGVAAAQFTSFKIAFPIDYDANAPGVLLCGDAIGIRIRRIAATANEIGGEFVVEGAVLLYMINKFGGL